MTISEIDKIRVKAAKAEERKKAMEIQREKDKTFGIRIKTQKARVLVKENKDQKH